MNFGSSYDGAHCPLPTTEWIREQWQVTSLAISFNELSLLNSHRKTHWSFLTLIDSDEKFLMRKRTRSNLFSGKPKKLVSIPRPGAVLLRWDWPHLQELLSAERWRRRREGRRRCVASSHLPFTSPWRKKKDADIYRSEIFFLSNQRKERQNKSRPS